MWIYLGRWGFRVETAPCCGWFFPSEPYQAYKNRFLWKGWFVSLIFKYTRYPSFPHLSNKAFERNKIEKQFACSEIPKTKAIYLQWLEWKSLTNHDGPGTFQDLRPKKDSASRLFCRSQSARRLGSSKKWLWVKKKPPPKPQVLVYSLFSLLPVFLGTFFFQNQSLSRTNQKAKNAAPNGAPNPTTSLPQRQRSEVRHQLRGQLRHRGRQLPRGRPRGSSDLAEQPKVPRRRKTFGQLDI